MSTSYLLACCEELEQNVTMKPERTRSDVMRSIVQAARDRLGMQEKEVNAAFHDLMTARGIKAPRAIMTRVRDQRRPLTFTKAEANAIAEVLKIDPSPLLPTDLQASLLSDDGDDQNARSAPQAEARIEPVKSKSPQGQEPKPELTPPPASNEKPDRIIITPAGKDLRLIVDYVMTPVQLERFTLAIPVYMISKEHVPTGIRVRANIAIFPYQAELIMRAIFGRR